MTPYTHKVQYYETDMMGLTHHSNYIRWMEEARIDFMDQLGFPYTRMEAAGILSPVKAVACDYRHPSTFGDTISVAVTAESFNGVVLAIAYEMKNEAGDTVCTARSEHVFLHRDGTFARLKRELPEFCEALERVMSQQTNNH